MTHLRRATVSGCGLLSIAIVLVVGCEEGPGKTPKQPPAQTHVLTPPTWIHGTWGYCDPVPTEFYWKFSAHNIEFRFGVTVTDYSEQSKVSGVKIREDKGDGWYRFEVESPDGRGGSITARNRFALEGSSLRWTTTVSGTSTTSTICRT
jgi:hypothetical protein